MDELECTVCGSAAEDHNMMLCDGCDIPQHIFCFAPALDAVPDGEWYCDEYARQARTIVKQGTRHAR